MDIHWIMWFLYGGISGIVIQIIHENNRKEVWITTSFCVLGIFIGVFVSALCNFETYSAAAFLINIFMTSFLIMLRKIYLDVKKNK
jgi:uncharacterized membrane protein YeaQ/YmgE (transglycosylase-associated protein family)